MWPQIEADGTTWQVRVLASPSGDESTEILEFTPVENIRPVRRLAVARNSSNEMSEPELFIAYRMARPIGADFYGRPGKRMHDAN
jgi:hypothetical protein